MISCPNCKHNELEGALFCSECGAQLLTPVKDSLHSPQELITNRLGENGLSSTYGPSQNSFPDSDISLHILDAGQIIPLLGRQEFTIGRSTEGQSILPDIDLTSFRAYENGVSRMHACIKISNHLVTITDLGSANGTRLNGKKIPAQQIISLSHGDILTLGKLKVQVIIR